MYLFSCSDNKNDRCTNPSPVSYTGQSQADAGKLGTLANSNLITDTDPFPAVGGNTPHDSTVEARILKSVIPGTEVLVNVCSYPSAGNGGNNNPFDCIVNPGGGFLVITKDAGTGVTSPTFGFTANPGAVTRSIAGSGTATAIPLTVTTSASVGETTIPSPWALNSASCVKSGGGSTGGALNTTTKTISSITIESGLITTCTFVDRIPTGTLTVIKAVTNDNGGTKVASDFTYNVGDGSHATETAAASPGKSYTLAVGATWNVTENGTPIAGYTTSYSTGCSGTMTSGGSFTCTVTNDDTKASPGASTVMKWTLNDRLGLTSFRTGGTGGTATFTLYKDSATCAAASQVFTETVNVNNATGAAATTTGYTTEVNGTYRWVVELHRQRLQRLDDQHLRRRDDDPVRQSLIRA